MNLQQRVVACRQSTCPSCGAHSGQPCVFTKDGALGIFRKGSPMRIHHDARWQVTKGWPFGPLEEWPLGEIDQVNAKDSEGRE